MVAVFDLDGTLFDTKSEIIKSMNNALIYYGIKEITSSEENKFIGPSFKTTLLQYRKLEPDVIKMIILMFRKCYINNVNKSKPYNGVIELLSKLTEKGIHLGIATNKPFNQVDILFKKYDFYRFFYTIKTKDDNDKLKAEMLIEIKEEANDNELYMIGDTLGDLEASRCAGYQFIEASYGYGSFSNKNELKAACPLDIIDLIC